MERTGSLKLHEIAVLLSKLQYFVHFMLKRVPVVLHCSEGHVDIRNELQALEIKIP